MRTQRLFESTPELDASENTWWNANSEVIEKTWAHTYSMQRSIRLHYLKKAKKFLQDGNEKKTIWEVGCGTGWVCRMIADKDFHVIGTDFSKAQIDTAKEMAHVFKKTDYCTYKVADASTVVEGHDDIFIHALLHHLTEVELKGFFKIFDTQPSGSRVFMYEPVFTEAYSDKKSIAALLFKKFIGAFRRSVNLLIQLTGKRNNALISEVQLLSKQADEKGWFLSPKEVPFYEDELENYLNKIFTIQKKYFVNYTDYAIAQSLVFYGINESNFIFRNIIFPISRWLDTTFFKLDFRSATQGQYFFCCYELIKR